MKSRGIWMLLVALLAGLAAVVLAATSLRGQNPEAGRIAVANTDIELGSRISPEMVRMVDWPAGSVPAGAYKDGSQLEGRVILVSMQRGEPITDGRLAHLGSKGGLSAVVPQGKRAMTVRVNDVIGVAGFALPGTFVDVMVNTQDEGGQRSEREHSVSKIVLERILVLAVAQESDRDATKPRVVNAVTLELTPKEAELLDLARSVGTLSLVLRNQIDPKADVATAGATKVELLGLSKAAAAPATPVVAAAPPVRRTAPSTAAPALAVPPVTARNCVEVIRGLSRTTECF